MAASRPAGGSAGRLADFDQIAGLPAFPPRTPPLCALLAARARRAALVGGLLAIKFTLLLLLDAHVGGCTIWYLAAPGEEMFEHGLGDAQGWGQQWVLAIYWAVTTLCTVGGVINN